MSEQLRSIDAASRPPLREAPTLNELASRFRGQDVVLVGNGPTGKRDYSSLGLPLWVVNGGWRFHAGAELCWMMDDLEGPAWDMAGTPASPREVWEPITQACSVPIMTSVAYPEKFPQTVEYPLQDIMLRFPKGPSKAGPRVYFAETICYATAWAIQIGVRSISFGGCDYGTIRPAERAGLEYWIGRAEEAGIEVKVFPGSQLLSTGRIDGKNRHIPGVYGYNDWPAFANGGYEVGDFPNGTGLPDDDDGKLGSEALEYLLSQPDIKTVLDVGYGSGDHAREIAQTGRRVVGVDPSGREGYNDQHNGGSVFFLRNDYLDPENQLSERFDAVWCCHVLEHVENPQAMLRRIRSDLAPGGLLAITVPPAQHAIVGGHFTLWNAGLLLYHLILAGFDCREAKVKQHGYNISVLLRRRDAQLPDDLPANYPAEKLRPLFPDGLEWEHGTFNGDIRELNW